MRLPATIIFVFALLSFITTGAADMLGIGKTCVFSAVKARLLLNGKPVVNTKVRREWNWNKPGFDESVTDEQGYVTFPAVFESSVTKLLPIELVISQRMLVEIDGEFKEIWLNDKRSPEEDMEYPGKKFNVICELTDEEKHYDAPFGNGKLTICKLNMEE